MARVPVDKLDNETRAELCCTYAALILHDGGAEITGTNIKRLLDASNNTVDSFWPGLFAKALAGRNIGELLLGGGQSAGPAGGAATTSAPADNKDAKAPAKAEPKKEEKKPEPEPEEDMDMGNLFGF